MPPTCAGLTNWLSKNILVPQARYPRPSDGGDSIDLNSFIAISNVVLSLSKFESIRKLLEVVSSSVLAGAVLVPTPTFNFATSGVASVILRLVNLFESFSFSPLTYESKDLLWSSLDVPRAPLVLILYSPVG